MRRCAVQRLKSVMVLLAVCTLAGCASIVSNTDSTTYVETVPEKCKCTLHGQDFQRVIYTPDSISLPAKAAPLTIMCEADNYQSTSAVLDTKADGWIIGNILFGGIVGAVVDAGRGAGQKYPAKFTLQLDPVYFASEKERDDYYTLRVQLAKTGFEEKKHSIVRRYSNDSQDSARERLLAALEKDENAELLRLETNRLHSVIGPQPEAATHVAQQTSPQTSGN